MFSSFGTHIQITIGGGSHSDEMTLSIKGLPAGEQIDEAALLLQMARRAPGRDETATARREPDLPEFKSGLAGGTTTGEPLCAVIRNLNRRSGDYAQLQTKPRPSHADYPAMVKYGGACDLRGGGHFSGRLTAPLTLAGSIARQILARRGLTVGGHVLQIGSAQDEAFDPVQIDAPTLTQLSRAYFPTLSPGAQAAMQEEILAAKQNGDSVGGLVELAATGLPIGLGAHMFRGIENVVSAALFGVPAVKAVSFGDGFAFGAARGTEAGDAWYYTEQGAVKTRSNHCGGVVGGMATGMPLLIRAALKPTPSIAAAQQTIDVETKQNTSLSVAGRHDPCIVPRAVPALEAALLVALLDLMAEENRL